MKILSVLLVIVVLPINNFANKTTTNEKFLESFNLRYSDPKSGIESALNLKIDSLQYAYLSIAFNSYFLSDYDSSNKYLERITEDDELIYNMALTCQALIDQRLGNYFKSYQKLDSAQKFYERKLVPWFSEIFQPKTRNDKILAQGFVENALGKISLEYYYLEDFDKTDNSINNLKGKIKKWELPLTNDLRFKIAFMEVQNYLNNSPGDDEKTDKYNSFKASLDSCIRYTDSSSYYQLGNLFETLGLCIENSKIKKPQEFKSSIRDESSLKGQGQN